MLPSLRVWTVVQLEAVLPMLLKQAALSSYVEYGSRPAQFNCVCHTKLIKQKNVLKSHHNQALQNKKNIILNHLTLIFLFFLTVFVTFQWYLTDA